MILDKPITGCFSAELTEEAHEEEAALEAMFRRASQDSARKDAVRWAQRAADKVLAEHELLGFQGVQITRGEDGALVFTGIPREIPRFLKSA